MLRDCSTESNLVRAGGRMASIMVMAEEAFRVRASIVQHPIPIPIPAGEVAVVKLATMELLPLT